MDEEIVSLRRQLKRLHEHLLTIEEQEVEYIDPRSIPPDLAKSGERVRDRIETKKQRLVELGYAPHHNGIVGIPIVIVAMTSHQAQELLPIADSADEYASFHSLKQQFPEDTIRTWVAHYSDNREYWQPHTFTERSIRDIVSEIVSSDSMSYRRTNSPTTVPYFCTPQFFSNDDDVQERIWCEIATSGGVLIVDAISLFHPDIRQTLSDSGLMSRERVAIVMMSPIDPMAHKATQLLEIEFRKRIRRAFARFDRHLDKLCEVGVGDLRSLRRWLFAILPEACANIQRQRPNSATLGRVWHDQGEEPRGIHTAFAGLGGGQ